MRNLASVQRIKSLSPIEGADKIEKAEILGWECVVKVGEFKVGDLAIYCEIDSVLPELSCFEFLRSRKFRIRTVRLMKQISQGIAFPLSILLNQFPVNDPFDQNDINELKEGYDLTDVLGIIKYDPEAADEVQEQEKKSWLSNKISYYKWKLFGIRPVKHKDGFPVDCPKTDENRVQVMGGQLAKREGQPIQISEKCEGQSFTFIYRKNKSWLSKFFGQDSSFQVCSRNRVVFNSLKGGITTNHLVKVAEKYHIYESMKKLNCNLAIQAECIGPKVQGNIYKLPEHEIRVFSIFDIDNQKYVDYERLVDLCVMFNLPMVPIIGFENIKNDIKYYVELSKGKSQINSSILREGIVCRHLTENFSFKSINPEYLLGQKD